MREMNLTYDEESVQKLFGKMDTNKDGRIQFDEWQVRKELRSLDIFFIE